VAGLKRLGCADRITALIDPADSLPAIGQGALALECRADRAGVIAALTMLADPVTTVTTTAERAFGKKLAGDCHTPLAAYATMRGSELWLRGLIASRDGRRVLRGERCANATSAVESEALGDALGADFLARGAAQLLST
jgi:hydroxymethylbilane synthase